MVFATYGLVRRRSLRSTRATSSGNTPWVGARPDRLASLPQHVLGSAAIAETALDLRVGEKSVGEVELGVASSS